MSFCLLLSISLSLLHHLFLAPHFNTFQPSKLSLVLPCLLVHFDLFSMGLLRLIRERIFVICSEAAFGLYSVVGFLCSPIDIPNLSRQSCYFTFQH